MCCQLALICHDLFFAITISILKSPKKIEFLYISLALLNESDNSLEEWSIFFKFGGSQILKQIHLFLVNQLILNIYTLFHLIPGVLILNKTLFDRFHQTTRNTVSLSLLPLNSKMLIANCCEGKLSSIFVSLITKQPDSEYFETYLRSIFLLLNPSKSF